VAGILSFSGRYRILHLTWFAFFLTFVVWFNYAPVATVLKADFGLTEAQLRPLLSVMPSPHIPAPYRHGSTTDYVSWLWFYTIPCSALRCRQELVYSRLSVCVFGIRMVAEWFVPRKRLGRRHLWRLGNVGSGLLLDSPSIAAATAFLAVGQIN